MNDAAPVRAASAAPSAGRRFDLLAVAVRFQSVIGLVLVAIGGIIFSPRRHGHILFLAPDNMANIVRAVSETGIIAVGMTFVIITAGIDLSVGALLSLCSVLTATIMTSGGYGLIPTVLIVVLCGSAFGAAPGSHLEPFPARTLHRHARRPSDRARACAGHLRQPVHQHFLREWPRPRPAGVRHSRRPAVQQRRAGRDPGVRGRRRHRDVRAELHPLRALCLRRRRQRTRGPAFGRAGLAGQGVSVYAITGFVSAIAGIVHAGQFNFGSANDGTGYELVAIASVVIGGTSLFGGSGSMIGTVAGAVMLGALANILQLNNINAALQLLATGAIIVLAAVLQSLVRRREGLGR